MATYGLNNMEHMDVGRNFSDHEQKMLEAFHSGNIEYIENAEKKVHSGGNSGRNNGHKGDET